MDANLPGAPGARTVIGPVTFEIESRAEARPGAYRRGADPGAKAPTLIRTRLALEDEKPGHGGSTLAHSTRAAASRTRVDHDARRADLTLGEHDAVFLDMRGRNSAGSLRPHLDILVTTGSSCPTPRARWPIEGVVGRSAVLLHGAGLLSVICLAHVLLFFLFFYPAHTHGTAAPQRSGREAHGYESRSTWPRRIAEPEPVSFRLSGAFSVEWCVVAHHSA